MPSNDHAAAKRYDLVFNLFGLDFGDPDQILSAFLSQGTLDLFNLSSAELLAMIQRARLDNHYEVPANYLQNQLAIVMPLFYRQRAYLLNSAYRFKDGQEGSTELLSLKNK